MNEQLNTYDFPLGYGGCIERQTYNYSLITNLDNMLEEEYKEKCEWEKV